MVSGLSSGSWVVVGLVAIEPNGRWYLVLDLLLQLLLLPSCRCYLDAVYVYVLYRIEHQNPYLHFLPVTRLSTLKRVGPPRDGADFLPLSLFCIAPQSTRISISYLENYTHSLILHTPSPTNHPHLFYHKMMSFAQVAKRQAVSVARQQIAQRCKSSKALRSSAGIAQALDSRVYSTLCVTTYIPVLYRAIKW